ncbi:MAG: hypothetical protein ACI9TH_001705 [Kiritimatiellia bacterium]|jgi:hypothetical protein
MIKILRLLTFLLVPFASLAAPIDRLVSNVTEAADFQLLYELALPNDGSFQGGNPVPYTTHDLAGVTGSFDRVAYYLELEDGSGSQWVYVSMDAFSFDPVKLGIPHSQDNPVLYQQVVSNMHVLASANANVATGVFANTGNIEFWPSNYGRENTLGIANASATVFDFGDGGANTAAGYGSFQVHNHDIDGSGANTVGETIFAYNHWGSPGTDEVGIGDRPGQPDSDWTFTGNAGSYTLKNLLILVMPAPPSPAPTGLAVIALSDTMLVSSWNTVSNSTEYLVFLNGDLAGRTATNTFMASCLLPETTYELMVRAITPEGLTALSPPVSMTTDPIHVFDRVPEAADYQLLYSLDIPVSGRFRDGTPVPYCEIFDTGITQAIARVAYYLELGDLNDSQWVYASMDTFSQFPDRLGLPHNVNNPVAFAEIVSNLHVIASANANVTTGTFARTGNIEFWPSSYAADNERGIPNATNTYDFGDGGFSTGAGYGSFQVHNHDVDGAGANTFGETLFAYNRWGDGNVSDIGIGNQPVGQPDWTFSMAASGYAIRSLRVLIQLSDTTPPPPAPTNFVLTSVGFCDATLSWDRTELSTGYVVRVDGIEVAEVQDPSVRLTGLLPSTTVQVSVAAKGFVGISPFSPDFAVTTTAPSVFVNVPDANDYELVYALPVENDGNYRDANPVAYCVDRRAEISGPFDRIAYYLELNNGVVDQWVFVSMDSFTTDVGQIGLPHNVDNPVAFQVALSNMHVLASANANVTTGIFPNTGWIEFWPSSYGDDNLNGIPNASDDVFDFGDSGFSTAAGHSSFQVHNSDLDGPGAGNVGETLFGFNHWGAGGSDELGIGNQPTGQPDWTFANNAATYQVKNLLVLVRTEGSLSDRDLDGVSDADEAIAGTDPDDPNSFPSIGVVLNPAGSPGELQFQSVVGRSYQVQLSLSLSPPEWIDFITVSGDDTLKKIPLPATGVDRLYYQLLIELE